MPQKRVLLRELVRRVVEVPELWQPAEAALEVGADQPRREGDLPGRGLALAEEQVVADVVRRRLLRVEDEVVLLCDKVVQ